MKKTKKLTIEMFLKTVRINHTRMNCIKEAMAKLPELKKAWLDRRQECRDTTLRTLFAEEFKEITVLMYYSGAASLRNNNYIARRMLNYRKKMRAVTDKANAYFEALGLPAVYTDAEFETLMANSPHALEYYYSVLRATEHETKGDIDGNDEKKADTCTSLCTLPNQPVALGQVTQNSETGKTERE